MNYYFLITAIYSESYSANCKTATHSTTAGSVARVNASTAALNIIRLAGIAVEHFGHGHRPICDSLICASAAFTLLQDLSTSLNLEHFFSCVNILHAQANRSVLSGALARALFLAEQLGAGQLPTNAYHSITNALEQNLVLDYETLQTCDDEAAYSSQGRNRPRQICWTELISSKFPCFAISHGGTLGPDQGKLDVVLEELETAWRERGGR